MAVQEPAGERNVLVWYGRRVKYDGAIISPGVLQKLAIERAGDGNFAPGTAADRADIALHPGAESPRAAGLANRTRHSFSIGGGRLFS